MIVLPLLGSPAWACAVCGAGTTVDQTWYLVMTIIMSLLPLAMIGGVGLWLYRAAASAKAPTSADASR